MAVLPPLTLALCCGALLLPDFRLSTSTAPRLMQQLALAVALLCYGLAGLLGVTSLGVQDSACDLASMSLYLASFVFARLSLLLHLSASMLGTISYKMIPIGLLGGLLFFSFGLQTAAVGHLTDQNNFAVAAGFLLDMFFLGAIGSFLLSHLLRDLTGTYSPTLSPVERQLSPPRKARMTQRVPRHIESQCYLLATIIFWLAATSLNLLMATQLRDYSVLVPPSPRHHPAWLSWAITTILGFICLVLDEKTSTCDSTSPRKPCRKSFSPVWPTESARKRPTLSIEPFEHPFSVPMASPTISEAFLKSIEDDLGSPSFRLDRSSAAASSGSLSSGSGNLIVLDSPPSPHLLSPLSSTFASAGHLPLRSPSVTSFPFTPDLHDEDLTVVVIPTPSGRDTIPTPPPMSPLPSIPEEDSDDGSTLRTGTRPDASRSTAFTDIPIRPEPAETKLVSARFHRPTQSAASALGISI